MCAGNRNLASSPYNSLPSLWHLQGTELAGGEDLHQWRAHSTHCVPAMVPGQPTCYQGTNPILLPSRPSPSQRPTSHDRCPGVGLQPVPLRVASPWNPLQRGPGRGFPGQFSSHPTPSPALLPLGICPAPLGQACAVRRTPDWCFPHLL